MDDDCYQIGPACIAKELNSQGISGLLRSEGHFFVLMSPNLPPGTLRDRAKSPEVKDQLTMYQNKLVETNGKGWLGELFLILNTDMKKVDEKKQDSDMDKEENRDQDAREKNSDFNDYSNDEAVLFARAWGRKHEKETDAALEDEEEKSVKKNNKKKSAQTEGPKPRAQKRKHELVEYGEDEEKKRTKKKSKIK